VQVEHFGMLSRQTVPSTPATQEVRSSSIGEQEKGGRGGQKVQNHMYAKALVHGWYTHIYPCMHAKVCGHRGEITGDFREREKEGKREHGGQTLWAALY
jgi:hypothetical protein